MNRNVAVIILAAGLGTRMKSDKAKVLHEVVGKPMIHYVVETAIAVAGNNVVLVVGHQADKVRKTAAEIGDFTYAFQDRQLGTGHAVLCALPCLPAHIEEVVILCGDTPLISPATLTEFIDNHVQDQRDISLLAVKLENPSGYGRVLLDKNDRLYAIVEESDATSEQKQIKIINSGIYCINKQLLHDTLPKISADNAQNEIYLTDIVEIGHMEKKKMGIKIGRDPLEIIGINNLQDLALVESVIRNQTRNKT
jgi:UDP-N-acetylglucosamine diphosphorylase/glucosamine-1-phosphate N-acetyltransferase